MCGNACSYRHASYKDHILALKDLGLNQDQEKSERSQQYRVVCSLLYIQERTV